MTWKEQAWLWFTRAAQFWLIQTVLAYLCACAIARRPIGPVDYVRFSYHVIQWHPGQAGESNNNGLSEREVTPIYGKEN